MCHENLLNLISVIFMNHCQNIMKRFNYRCKQHVSMFISMNLLTDQGPVVQSVVSLTNSLRVISLTVLADSIHSILIFFAKKM